MDKDYVIKLTLAVYQASQYWPESNLLQFKIRSLVKQILTDCILISHENPGLSIREQLVSNIQDLQQDLAEIRAQKLISRKDFLFFQKEYAKIGHDMQAFKVSKPAEQKDQEIQASEEGQIKNTKIPVKKIDLQGLNQRQKQIIKILKQKQKIQVCDLKESFPSISKRTLRRDVENLLKKKIVQRSGQWNQIFYVLPN